MEKWRGKVAVVTGASAGIGRALVKDLIKAGLIVIGLARRVENIEGIKNELGTLGKNLHSHKCDVSNSDSIKETFSWIEKQFKTIHIIVNNAGISRQTEKLLDTDNDNMSSLQQIINTNFVGLVQCTNEAFKLMKKNDDYGIIINVNSILGHTVPFITNISPNVYPGTKHAVSATTEVIRQELVKMNNNKIRVSSVSPGVVETEIRVAGGLYTKENNLSYSTIPHLKAEDVSATILCILSMPYHVNITELTVKPVGEPF